MERLKTTSEGGRQRISLFENEREKGYLIIEPKRNEPKVGYIVSIKVPIEEERFLGIGNKLVSHALSAARNGEYEALTLEVEEDNTVAYEWYERLGFKITERNLGLNNSVYLTMVLQL